MNKEVMALIAPILATGGLLRPGRKHAVLILPNGRRTGIPTSPSDRRAIHNLRSQLKRLQATRTVA
ncbi:phosphoribosylglycinamide formyltransferase [Chromobacterium sinusclupearum]|uniref:Phosphoribosylglycinamide formyltransferase n=1 Tax=Chromobacterium sinusclupearum TaxID=2077146 RepID=A0A2K4MSP0_9NEIS|nr:phosphoribosylglycinamide formyltransferase [Chromobacterium sinusclupearum]